jgi:hypothetical protein
MKKKPVKIKWYNGSKMGQQQHTHHRNISLSLLSQQQQRQSALRYFFFGGTSTRRRSAVSLETISFAAKRGTKEHNSESSAIMSGAESAICMCVRGNLLMDVYCISHITSSPRHAHNS